MTRRAQELLYELRSLTNAKLQKLLGNKWGNMDCNFPLSYASSVSGVLSKLNNDDFCPGVSPYAFASVMWK